MKKLNEMTIKELKEIAKELKVSSWWNLKKDDLIKKIDQIQKMTLEEKAAAAEQKAREDAALMVYRKHWARYTKKFNPTEFIEKFRSGKITLEGDPHKIPVEKVEKVEPEKPKLVQMPGTDGDWGKNHFDPDSDHSDPDPLVKPKRGQLIEFNGKAQNICAWAKELGISPNTLYGRIYRMGWSIEKAFTTTRKQ